MKAMVFAAGLGTRLRPLTDSMPKALVEVGGVAALQRALHSIRDAGIVDVVVNVHHFPQMIRDFLHEKDNFGLNISISDESEQLLDTGGGLLRALEITGQDEPVLLHNADIVSDLRLEEMTECFEREQCDAMLLTSVRDSSRRLLFDADGIMHGWKNMSTGETRPDTLDDSCLEPRAFGGIHIVGPRVFPLLKDYARQNGDVFSITPFYVASCSECRIRSYTPSRPFRWFDIGRPESLAAAQSIDLPHPLV